MLRSAHSRRESPSLLARYSETFGELTLRRQTELAMAAAKAESDLANRAKSALLGTMSHELRTPLNAIIGFSDLIRTLKGEDAATKSVDYAGYIGDAGRHLLEVVTDILDMSKLESGAFVLELQPTSIAQIVADALPIVAGRIAAKGQHIEVRVQRGIPKQNVDARRIKQILINLLSNANKFTPEGGHILLTARANKDRGSTIAIVDTGVGMSEEDIRTALAPFGQVQSHLSRTQEGTGLGLPIARGLARQHGGDLYLESEPGAGTTAVLTLPGPDRTGQPLPSGGGERRRPRRAAHSSKD
ncbi:MAG TPA: ATP-binding protein [Caulobacteraceae bacterium]|nr:ATP-binding protein [Caulobacteraceae bacterium]